MRPGMPTPEEDVQNIESRLQSIEADYRQRLALSNNIGDLDAAKADLFSDGGDLIQVLRGVRLLPLEYHPQVGDLVVSFRDRVEAAYQERSTQIQ